MKKYLIVFLLLILQAQAQTALRDNFKDLNEINDQAIQDLSGSVAAMVQIKNIIPDVKKELLKEYLTLSEEIPTKKNLKRMDEISAKANRHILMMRTAEESKMCNGFEFEDQPMMSNCTGTLVGPDLLLTAGHCVKIQNFCKRFKWVFDYKIDHTQSTGVSSFDGVNQIRNSSEIYSCDRVVKKVHSKIPIYGIIFRPDVALVKLDKVVKNRKIVQVDLDYEPKKDDQIFLLSYPYGLPQKYSEGQIEQKITNSITMAKIAALGGSSGGPIFSKDTNKIISVLVRGPKLFKQDTVNKCEFFDYTQVFDGFTSGLSPLTKVERAFNRYQFKN